MKWKLFFATLLLIFSGACINGGFADKTKDTSSVPECMEILDLLSIIEGFDYSEVGIAKTLFGDEKINFEVDTWRGKCYYGIGTLDGKVVIVSNKPFRDPTLLAFSDSKTVKMLFRNLDEKLFMEALRAGKIRIEGVGFTNSFKVGLTNTFGRFMLPKPEISEKLNITIPLFNLTSPQDYDGDGIENSEDKCDPYLLKETLTGKPKDEQPTDPPVRYYTCPTRLSSEGENYLGDAPYIDIYDYVMNDGCGVKDTDGGLRYYTRGSICIENVSYSESRFYEVPFRPGGIIYVPGKVYSQCERVYTDYCLDDKTLVEYYYEPPHRVRVMCPPFEHPLLGKVVDVVDVWVSGGVRNVTIECPFGCSMGACIVKDVDSPPEELFFGPSVINGEVRYGWIDWSKGYYGQGQEEYVALKTGKNKNDISDQDYFGDECIDNKTLREYYLTVVNIPSIFGVRVDKLVVKSENYTCPIGCKDGVCTGPTCYDGIKNCHEKPDGRRICEEGVDCGGPCPPCRPINVCTQNPAVRYVPPDSPCEDKWREESLIERCHWYEICSDELDFIVDAAYRCAYGADSGYDEDLCNYAKEMAWLTVGVPPGQPGFEKTVAGIYIIEGLGDRSFEQGWMSGYLHEEFCCLNVLSDSKSDSKASSLCWGGSEEDCLINNASTSGSNFWYYVRICNPNRFTELTTSHPNVTQVPCVNRDKKEAWKSDIDLSKNSITYSHPPAHVNVNILGIGSCVDYSNTVTTLLRKAGYSCDEVFSACYPGHCWNIVKFPGNDSWFVVDTTNQAGGIILNPFKSCWVFNKTKMEEEGWCGVFGDPNNPHYCSTPLNNDCYENAPSDNYVRNVCDVVGCCK